MMIDKELKKIETFKINYRMNFRSSFELSLHTQFKNKEKIINSNKQTKKVTSGELNKWSSSS